MLLSVIEEFIRYDKHCKESRFIFGYNWKSRLHGVIDFIVDYEVGLFNMNNADSERNIGAYFAYKYIVSYLGAKQPHSKYEAFFAGCSEKKTIDAYFDIRIFENTKFKTIMDITKFLPTFFYFGEQTIGRKSYNYYLSGNYVFVHGTGGKSLIYRIQDIPATVEEMFDEIKVGEVIFDGTISGVMDLRVITRCVMPEVTNTLDHDNI